MNTSIDVLKPIPAEQVESFEAWEMPVLDSANEFIVSSGKNKARRGLGEEGKVVPLTASGIEALREEARQEGFNQGQKEGYQTGLQKGQLEINEIMARLNRMIGQLMHPIAEQDEELEQALVHLSSSIARSVVKKKVDFDVDMLLEMVRQAVSCLPEGSDNIRVLVHPRDAELIKKACLDGLTDWKVIADASLVSGGCIVKTSFSYIDYTLDRQFQLMVDQMLSEGLTEKNKSVPGQPSHEGEHQ